MVFGVTPEEARWLNDESARDGEYDETPREEALDYCRTLVGRYGGADELDTLTVVDAGHCDDCKTIVDARYELGQMTLCRHDAVLRLRARRHLAEPLELLSLEPAPVDAYGWMHANAGRHTDFQLRTAFRRWHLDDDTQIELLDLNHDLTEAA